jgi:hypothetical protein
MFIRYSGNGIGHQFAKQTVNAEGMHVDAEEQAAEDPGERGDDNAEDGILHQDLDISALEGDHSNDGLQDTGDEGLSESDGASDSDSSGVDSDDENSTPVIDFGPEDDNEDSEDDGFGSL